MATGELSMGVKHYCGLRSCCPPGKYCILDKYQVFEVLFRLCEFCQEDMKNM